MATLLSGVPCEDPSSLLRECAGRAPTDRWYGRANGFDLQPVGRGHGRGWLLLRGSSLSALGTSSDHTLTFSGTDTSHKYALRKVTVVSAECVTPGFEGDPLSTHLVHVADRRYHLARVPVDAAFNVWNADGTDYLTSTTNGGTAWTWQGVIDALVTTLGESTSQFALPFTPNGTPENLAFWGGSAWDALNDVLDRVACAPLYDPEADAFSVVRLGVSDAGAEAAQVDNVGERTWDAYPTDPARAWRPEKVRVRFLRRPAPTAGTSPYYTVDVTLATAPGVKAGTFVQLDDDAAALAATGTPSNSAALATRAAERAADWLRKRSGFGRPVLKVYRDFIPGVIRDVPGATVGSVAIDDRGGPMRTEVAARPDRLLEDWKPLSELPPWFPQNSADADGFWAVLTTSSGGLGVDWKFKPYYRNSSGAWTLGTETSTYSARATVEHIGEELANPSTDQVVWMRPSDALNSGSTQYEFSPHGYATTNKPGILSAELQNVSGVKRFEATVVGYNGTNNSEVGFAAFHGFSVGPYATVTPGDTSPTLKFTSDYSGGVDGYARVTNVCEGETTPVGVMLFGIPGFENATGYVSLYDFRGTVIAPSFGAGSALSYKAGRTFTFLDQGGNTITVEGGIVVNTSPVTCSSGSGSSPPPPPPPPPCLTPSTSGGTNTGFVGETVCLTIYGPSAIDGQYELAYAGTTGGVSYWFGTVRGCPFQLVYDPGEGGWYPTVSGSCGLLCYDYVSGGGSPGSLSLTFDTYFRGGTYDGTVVTMTFAGGPCPIA